MLPRCVVNGGRDKNSDKSGAIREQNPAGPEEETSWRGKEKEAKTQRRGHGEVRRGGRTGNRGNGKSRVYTTRKNPPTPP